jgi:phenylacetate-coenzyme A ligase PaaK-like adenylate-forming protein
MRPIGSPPAIARESEWLPLDRLLELSEQRLKDTLGRAESLPAETKAKIKADRHFDMDSLRRLPFMSRSGLIEMSSRQIGDRREPSRTQLWQSGLAESSSPVWFPRGIGDIGRQIALAGRMARVCGIKAGDCVLVLSQPGHGATNALPHVLASALKTASIPAQVISANITVDVHTNKWVDFVTSNPPSVIIAETKGALELAGYLRGPSQNKLTPDLRFILLYGVRSTAECEEVSRVYGAPVLQSFGLDGLDVFGVECAPGCGIHLWLDSGVYEMIPENAVQGESAVTGGKPASLWLWEAAEGTRGELVVTNFGDAMPLVRYRTGCRVEVAGSGLCSCGRTHPRIKLLDHPADIDARSMK